MRILPPGEGAKIDGLRIIENATPRSPWNITDGNRHDVNMEWSKNLNDGGKISGQRLRLEFDVEWHILSKRGFLVDSCYDEAAQQ